MILKRDRYDICDVIDVYIDGKISCYCYVIDTRKKLVTMDKREAERLGIDGEPVKEQGVDCLKVKVDYRITAKLDSIIHHCRRIGMPQSYLLDQAKKAGIEITS